MDNVTEEDWTEIYTQLFKPAIEGSRLKYRCTRSQIRNGAFTKDIVQNLKNAHVVLADLTFFNPNVMWELGIRHALAKRTILVARKDIMNERIISDLSIYGVIPYDPTNLTRATEFKTKIKDALKDIDSDPNRSDNPVFDFIKEQEIILTNFDNKKNIQNLTGLISELITDLFLADKIMSGKATLKKSLVTRQRYSIHGIEYILSTNYLTIDELQLKRLSNIMDEAIVCNRELNNIDMLLTEGKDIFDSSFDDIKKFSEKLQKKTPLILEYLVKLLKDLQQNKLEYKPPNFLLWDTGYSKYLK